MRQTVVQILATRLRPLSLSMGVIRTIATDLENALQAPPPLQRFRVECFEEEKAASYVEVNAENDVKAFREVKELYPTKNIGSIVRID